MTQTAKLEVKSLTKTFGTARDRMKILSDISLQVNEGELVALIGPSGCGKTTLLDCIAHLTDYGPGQIYISGVVDQKNRNTAYMMQDDGLLPWRTTIDNIILPLQLRGTDKKKARDKARLLISKFGLRGFENYYPSQLSGGMRQRAALLRTYLQNRDIMLLDEPFARLDALTKLSMQEWFLDIWQDMRKTVLIVTHDIDEAILMSDRIYVLSPRPGKIVGKIEVPLPRPRKQYALTNSQFVSIKKNILDLLSMK